MKFIEVNIKKDNRLNVDGTEYFILYKKNKAFVLPAKCPHRGGPLQYGNLENNGEQIVCPWHENKFKIKQLNCKEFASIQISNKLILVTSGKNVVVWHENLPTTLLSVEV